MTIRHHARGLANAAALTLTIAAFAVTNPGTANAIGCVSDSGPPNSYDYKNATNDGGGTTIKVKTNQFWVVCTSGSGTQSSIDYLKFSYEVVNGPATPYALSDVFAYCTYTKGTSNTMLAHLWSSTPTDKNLTEGRKVSNLDPADVNAPGYWTTTNLHYSCSILVDWDFGASDSFTLSGSQN